MELKGIGWMDSAKKKPNLENKSKEWLLTEKMKLEEGMKNKRDSKATRTSDIRAMEKISLINSELMARR
jgi:hypothetical protein